MKLSRIAHAGLEGAKLIAKHPGTYIEYAWAAGRRFCFAIIFIALLASKFIHIYAHYTSLPPSILLLWGSTFFLQDIFLIFLARGLTCDIQWRVPRIAAAILTVFCT